MQSKFRLKNVKSNELTLIDKPSITIGRSNKCDISIDSGLLSRYHVSITVRDDDTILLKDLDSTNGTFVNSMRVSSQARIQHRDVLTVGDEKFVFINSESESDQSIFTHGIPQLDTEPGEYSTMVQSPYFSSFNKANTVSGKGGLKKGDSVKMVTQALSDKALDANVVPAVLIISSGRKTGTLIELKLPFGAEKQWELGRGELCDVIVDDPTVSVDHAYIRWDNGCWEIVDNNSTNGIQLNGVKVNRSLFESGDTLSIGNVKMIFRLL